MKLKQGYVLREIAGSWAVLPLRGVNLDGIIKLNGSGALLWQAMEQGADYDELVSKLTSEYDVSVEDAKNDVRAFLNVLLQYGCVEE